MLWRLLVNCWEHDPEVRPSAHWVHDTVSTLSNPLLYLGLTHMNIRYYKLHMQGKAIGPSIRVGKQLSAHWSWHILKGGSEGILFGM
jgi:hypothetical protein